MTRDGLDRRSLLQRTGLVSLGLAASGGLISAAAGFTSRPLTASLLKPLVGKRLTVSGTDWTGDALVLPLSGNGNYPVKERSFQLRLSGDRRIAAEGQLLTIEHSSIGQHELFFAPDRNRTRWIAVVQDVGTVQRLSRQMGVSRG